MITALVIALVTLVVHGIRVRVAPDVFGDEGLYYLVARNVASGVGLHDDNGVFFWHPPVFPLLEAAWIRLTGAVGQDFLTGLLASRELNVMLSSATAAMLFLLGRRLGDWRTGVIAAVLFVADAFVQRTNRRSMIETLAMLLVVVGLYLFDRYARAPGRGALVGAGVVLGLAVLTKEVAVVGLLAAGTYVVLFRRDLVRPFAVVAGIGALMYSAYVAWAVLIGEGDRFLAFKLSAVSRALRLGQGLVPREARVDPGVNPGLLERLGPALAAYAATYVLLLVAGLLLVLMVLRYRSRPGGQLLIAWGGVSYAGVIAAQAARFGDQFFYYALVPATVIFAYVLTSAWSVGRAAPAERRDEGEAVDLSKLPRRPAGRMLLVGLAAVLLGYNLAAWTTRFVLARDDSYTQIVRQVEATVPEGSAIVAGADVANFLLRPEYRIEFFRDRESVRRSGVRYFILSSKEAEQGYNRVTPEFYSWVMENTTPVLELEGETYHRLGLYEWSDPVTSEEPQAGAP